MSVRLKWIGVVAVAATALCGCGGGTSSIAPTAPTVNTLTATIDGGPSAVVQVNGLNENLLYASVTICVPGSTSHCQTIDHVQIDTSSVGLRIMGSLLNASLLSALQQPTTSAGQPVFECAAFGDGYSWGPLTSVDVQFTSDEKATAVPIQIIEDPTSVNIPAVPADCQSSAGADVPENTPATFGANGLLGVGALLQDCGSTCLSASTASGYYYACTSATSSGTCTDITMSLADQVQNPVALIAGADNNGVAIQLPAVNPPGAPTATGTLYFGVGTQSNNALGTVTVFQLDSLYGEFVDTQYAGADLPESVLDIGSNAYYFNSSITQCTDVGYYCPASTTAQSATIQGQSAIGAPTGTQLPVTFDIGNADSLLSGTNTAIPNLGGPGASGSFDWGLPFFYGRTLYVVFEERSASGSGQAGPYVAF